MSVKPDRPCCEAEYYELVGQYKKLAALEVLERGTPECDEFLRLRGLVRSARPCYTSECTHCGKKDHTGMSNDPRVSTYPHIEFCSEDCYTQEKAKRDNYRTRLKNREIDDFPELMGVRDYIQMTEWLCLNWLQNDAFRQQMMENHPLHGVAEFLAADIRMHSLYKMPPKYVSHGPARNMGESGSFTFKQPVPRTIALQSIMDCWEAEGEE